MDYGEKSELARKRRLKFSLQSQRDIETGVLTDNALLSRSSSVAVAKLKDSATEREQLVYRLRNLQKHDVSSDLLGHGLRKIREVLVSMAENVDQDDERFWKTALEVYITSYEYFMSKREYAKIGGIVLQFMVNKIPLKMMASEYKYLYAVYLSHVENNLDFSLQIALSCKRDSSSTTMPDKIIKLSIIYLQQSKPANCWFEIVDELRITLPLVYHFLTVIPAFEQMQNWALQTITKSYNQLRLDFLQDYWFHSMAPIEQIRDQYTVKETGNGIETIIFKSGKKREYQPTIK